MSEGSLIVIGSGIAGLTVALSVKDRPVTLVTPHSFGKDGSTWHAKGGIAAALGHDDSPQLHAHDTLEAGAGRGTASAIQVLCGGGADAIDWLRRHGALFDQSGCDLSLGIEGAHSAKRIIHAGGDQTGRAVARALSAAVRAGDTEILEGWELIGIATDDDRVCGVHLGNQHGKSTFLPGRDVVLATGGSGALYPITTNPRTALGTGVGCAIEAGAQTSDMALVQFHPTALAADSEGIQTDLLTEALRGAGACLIDSQGRRFMKGRHAQDDLAPRDIVSRAIWQQTGPVYLDARGTVGAHFPRLFPAAFRACMDAGIDPRREPMPVKPAAHYHMGGVKVDLDGRTTLGGLWACGECACTGVHGANRLASNSLLEGVVFGRRIGKAMSNRASSGSARSSEQDRRFPHDAAWSQAALKRLRAAMWKGMGLARNRHDLETTLAELEHLSTASAQRDRRTYLATLTALAMTRDGLQRRESVGAHYRTDYPVLEKTA